MEIIKRIDINECKFGEDTHRITYNPDPIDEYLVIVNNTSDWEEIHNYIINENEIDGIPNRSIECSNIKEYSLRSSIYLISRKESLLLKTHPKIEDVILNPDKYPQPQSLHTNRYKKPVAFNKPQIPADYTANTTPVHTNGIRSNWGHLFVSTATSEPFKGVGIASTTLVTSDVQYSLTGKNVDAVIIDSGISYLHPEFKSNDGTYRVKDVILDGPLKVDPNYFTSRNLTYSKIVDGINLGVGIASTSAIQWWTNSSKRSSQFQSLGSISTITSSYNLEHVSTKTLNPNNNQLIDGHGTACASQIGGKSFGLAFECNIWNIRVALGGAGGYLDPSTALDICTIFHNAKKISQNGNPDPTITNNSYGYTSSTGNVSGTTYTHGYRGSTLTYVGTGSDVIPPTNCGSCRNHKQFGYRTNLSAGSASYSGSGEYIPVIYGTSTSSSAENAIAAGVIVVTSAGNNNQKLSDYTDIDYNNWYGNSSTYINRVGGIQKGFSGVDIKGIGSIRVGALDCAVEPSDSKQGSTPYSIRRVCYSNNGPMIDVWSPAEYTMSAGYTTSYEKYSRQDDSNFYDTWFNGTSSATPNVCSLASLYLESNRKATQLDVRDWLNRQGSIEINLSDPYPNPLSTSYWSQTYNSTFDGASKDGDSYNVRGNGNLRGATKRVLYNPFANNTTPFMGGVNFSGCYFSLI